MIELFRSIEKRYDFALPQAFKTAWEAGWAGDNYLALPDLEWLPLEEIAEYEFEDYQISGLVPFASTGGGDLWCWQPAFLGPDGPRVIECPHDCTEASVYAPDFRSFLYRRLLDEACACFLDAEGMEEHRSGLLRGFEQVSALLQTEEREMLASVLNSPIQSEVLPAVRPTRWSFIVPPKSELQEFIRRSFPDEIFEWMRDD